MKSRFVFSRKNRKTFLSLIILLGLAFTSILTIIILQESQDLRQRAQTPGPGQITVPEVVAVLAHWETSSPGSDFNKDNVVNIIDLSIALSEVGL